VQELRLRVDARLGLHARPAARFVGALGGIDARVEVTNETRGRGPADGRSLTGLATLAVRQGDEIVVSASGATRGSDLLRRGVANLDGRTSMGGRIRAGSVTDPWQPCPDDRTAASPNHHRRHHRRPTTRM
jgi:phosphotransferase system HPr (HPr) family protein